MSKLVIVESPTKARTIRAFLPDDYRVEASMGHVRDLPSSAAEIPANFKGRSWARMGVDVENDFKPLYVTPRGKKKVVRQLQKMAEEADDLFIATDEDREGESIGWHLTELLGRTGPVKRLVFHEITSGAIKEALAHPRRIDLNLVRAQEARRILDRLVGYTLSPLLWKKIAPKLSAGRVQSVAVRLLVERERRRSDFHPSSYRDLKALLNKRPDRPEHRFEASLISLAGRRLASGKDFDENTGKIPEGKDLLLLDPARARELVEQLPESSWQVKEIKTKDSQRTPYPPFTTATLQMEANRKLNLSAGDTMRVAQRLYENGYITYMRTDSVHLSEEAISAARNRIVEIYGKDFLNPDPRRYRTRTKGAQEAHEAIRPAGKRMRTLAELKLEGKESALYDLIWKRAIATQMKPAQIRSRTATIAVQEALFRANGREVLFPGFLRAYVRGEDAENGGADNRETALPELSEGEEVDCRGLETREHETKPPARYNEATLIKALESEGIGRPSTYAVIIGTIVRRGYVFKERRELIPTFTAYAVIQLLEKHFPELVDIHFTAGMERDLDNIAGGKAGASEFLREFFLGERGLAALVHRKEEAIDPRSLNARHLTDPPVEVRIGKFGAFLSGEREGKKIRVSLSPQFPPADLTPDYARRLIQLKLAAEKPLTADPETGESVYLKLGPFGPYLQRGENGEKKPKRTPLLPGMGAEEVTPEIALKLLQFPRELGLHPETKKPVQARLGRFGPYLTHDDRSLSLKPPDDILEIKLERAVELLAQAPARRGRPGKKIIRELGDNPENGKPILILEGRWGLYLQHDGVNASLPADTDPASLNISQALLRLKSKKKRRRKKRN